MRADQWLMLGVLGVLGFAAYRLATAQPNQTEPLPEPQRPDPIPPPGTFPGVPNWIGRPPAPAGSVALSTGHTYLGRLEMTAATANPDEIQRTLENLGFTNVTVYTGAFDASEVIALPEALARPTAFTRWFRGTWSGTSGVKPVPPQLVLLWPTTSGVPFAFTRSVA